ncbi:uncharacterized protein LOC116413380 [Galleria mellonella]|uniref:Uncharacterized protein LOC116413380 n=1 Tax=Galleria mellonella TaxID=7137 RepID=A0A6J3C6R7_GALME|nr:uncharacterized protein LOC116413380 [Galleria mellonella]
MQVNLVLLIFLVLTTAFVHAEFYYNHVPPKEEDLNKLDLKCIPGRTTIKIDEKIEFKNDGSDEFEDDARRSHMNHETKDEYCKICVCSVEGKDQYCSRRPAMNVNECIRMAMLTDEFKKSVLYDNNRNLAYRIRRVGTDSSTCIPFVSEYTDCTEENRCSGCQRCECTDEAKWLCHPVMECDESDGNLIVDESNFEDALTKLKQDLKFKQMKESTKAKTPLVPRPSTGKGDNLLLGYIIAIPR